MSMIYVLQPAWWGRVSRESRASVASLGSLALGSVDVRVCEKVNEAAGVQ